MKHFACASPRSLTSSEVKTLIGVAEKATNWGDTRSLEVGKYPEDGFEKGPAPDYHGNMASWVLLLANSAMWLNKEANVGLGCINENYKVKTGQF